MIEAEEGKMDLGAADDRPSAERGESHHDTETADHQLHHFYRLLGASHHEPASSTPFPHSLVNIVVNELHFSRLARLELVGSKLPHRLTDNDVSHLVSCLLEANLPLQELHLPYHCITDVGFEEICRLLEPSNHLGGGIQVLDLTGNDIEGTCIQNSCLVSQYNCPLITLNLSFNPLSVVGHAALAAVVLQNQTLRRLLLNHCGFDLTGLNSLLSNFHENKALETLSLDRPILPNMQEGGIMEHFAKIIPSNRSLAHLSLKNHQLYDHHAVLLANTLFINNRMISLNLESNRIGVIGAEALASCLLKQQAQSLQYLGLSFNSVSDDGALALAEAIKGSNSNLRVLTLKNNRIGSVGLSAIAHALETSANLEQIVLFGNNFDNNNGMQFHDLLSYRLPYCNLHIDISVYIVDGKYMIAEN